MENENIPSSWNTLSSTSPWETTGKGYQSRREDVQFIAYSTQSVQTYRRRYYTRFLHERKLKIEFPDRWKNGKIWKKKENRFARTPINDHGRIEKNRNRGSVGRVLDMQMRVQRLDRDINLLPGKKLRRLLIRVVRFSLDSLTNRILRIKKRVCGKKTS